MKAAAAPRIYGAAF